MSYFSFRNQNIYYAEQGEGTPLVLLHGNCASSNLFYEIADRYARRYRVVLIDFLGHGRSDRLPSFPADLWYDEAQQVIALLRERRYQRADLIGTSGGALVAINAALEAPALVGRVIADSFEGKRAVGAVTEHLRAEREQAKQDEDARMFYYYMHGDGWEQVVDNDTEAVVRHEKEIGCFFHRALSTFQPELLLTGSRQDEFTAGLGPGFMEKTYREICAEVGHGQIHLFDGGRHPAMLSNRDAFYRLSLDFLSRGRTQDGHAGQGASL